MKQLMVRLAAALSVVAMLGLTGPAAHAQNPAGGASSEADQKAMAEYQKKARAIQAKFKPQLDAIQKKYKADLDKIQAKYKPKLDALQKEAQALKAEERKGPSGTALKAKYQAVNKEMAAEPAVKKLQSEMRPLVTRITDELLAVAPPRMKPLIKQQREAQLKAMGG